MEQINVYTDLETIPGQGEEVRAQLAEEADALKAAVSAPGNYKDPVKIEEYINGKYAEIDAQADQRWRKTALDGALGQIAVASIAINDEPPVSFYQEKWDAPDAERQIITNLYEFIVREIKKRNPGEARSPVTFVGHNLIGFDLPFLFKRSVILGIRPPHYIPFGAKPWDTDAVYDTMVQWSGGNRDYVAMDKICAALGIEQKGSELGEDISGEKVWDYVLAGQIAKVAIYCDGDVERTRQMHRRMTFQPLPKAA